MRGELWPIVTERIWLLNDDVGVVPLQLDRRFLALISSLTMVISAFGYLA
jgi:hypothetical protein